MCFRLDPRCAIPYPAGLSGPLAQLVEQLTFNQWVAGSNPARLTTVPKLTNDTWSCLARMMAGLAAEHGEEKTVMIDATYLKAHRTSTSLGVKKGGVDA
jgi:hypothetical protein